MSNPYYLDFTGGTKEADFDALNLRSSNYLGLREGSKTKRWATPLILDTGSTWRMPISHDVYDNVLDGTERSACVVWDDDIDPKTSSLTETESLHVTGAASALWSRDTSSTPDVLQLEDSEFGFLLEDDSGVLLTETAVSNLIKEDGFNFLLENGDLVLME